MNKAENRLKELTRKKNSYCARQRFEASRVYTFAGTITKAPCTPQYMEEVVMEQVQQALMEFGGKICTQHLLRYSVDITVQRNAN